MREIFRMIGVVWGIGHAIRSYRLARRNEWAEANHNLLWSVMMYLTVSHL